MRYLLDTHTFLWTVAGSKRLSLRARKEIEDPDNEILVSSVSFWEVAMKNRRGKLDLGGLRPIDLIERAKDMEILLIGLDPEEAATHGKLLEDTHFDPFDRMLIWQAISRKIVLISSDTKFKRFRRDGLKLLWN